MQGNNQYNNIISNGYLHISPEHIHIITDALKTAVPGEIDTIVIHMHKLVCESDELFHALLTFAKAPNNVSRIFIDDGNTYDIMFMISILNMFNPPTVSLTLESPNYTTDDLIKLSTCLNKESVKELKLNSNYETVHQIMNIVKATKSIKDLELNVGLPRYRKDSFDAVKDVVGSLNDNHTVRKLRCKFIRYVIQTERSYVEQELEKVLVDNSALIDVSIKLAHYLNPGDIVATVPKVTGRNNKFVQH